MPFAFTQEKPVKSKVLIIVPCCTHFQYSSLPKTHFSSDTVVCTESGVNEGCVLVSQEHDVMIKVVVGLGIFFLKLKFSRHLFILQPVLVAQSVNALTTNPGTLSSNPE